MKRLSQRIKRKQEASSSSSRQVATLRGVFVLAAFLQLGAIFDVRTFTIYSANDIDGVIDADLPMIENRTKSVDIILPNRTLAEIVSDPTSYRPKKRDNPYSWEAMGLPENPLTFLHIPKTGGSSVENAATAANISWGMCLFQIGVMSVKCPIRPDIHENDMSKSLQALHKLQNRYSFGTSFWHVPLQYLPVDFTCSIHHNPQWINPYAHHDIFVVIRNPYKRAVSEYYYHCNFEKCFAKGKQDTAEEMNRDIQQVLKAVKTSIRMPSNKNKRPSRGYFSRDSHWIPQYDYVYSTVSSGQQPQQIAKHVLHFENLEEEFHSLVAAYGLDLNLTAVGATYHSSHFKPNCTVADLTPETRALIEEVYEKDFELGGYTMIERMWSKHTALS